MNRRPLALLCLLSGIGAGAFASENAANAPAAPVQLPSTLEQLSAPDAGVQELVLRVDAGVDIPSSGLLVEGSTAVRLVPVERCATYDDAPQKGRAAQPRVIEREISRNPFVPRTIPINFHVVSNSRGEGAVSDGTIDEQVRILNKDFEGTGFSFVRHSITRTVNDNWFKLRRNTGLEMRVKDKLARNPETQLNIYLADGGGYLGWATFPWSQQEPELHGVVLNFRTLPGPDFLGHTATHEVGHFLGLYHTFEGGCVPPGDGVSDTEPEARDHYGCQMGRDSCPGGGTDPVTNFMSYSADACMTGFTREQIIRMQIEVMENRSRWQLGGVIAHGLANFEPRARFGDAAVMRDRLVKIDALLKQKTEVAAPEP